MVRIRGRVSAASAVWRRQVVLVVVVGLAAAGLGFGAPPAAADSITSPDTTGNVGLYTSVVLDAAGNPVISHYDASNGDLRVVHCNDPDCDPAVNGAESLTSPDTTGHVGRYTSLVLDAAGNPVISHYDATNDDLRVVHCNDPDCDSAVNGAESLTSPDTTGNVGRFTSLVLDAAGNPVISHHDASNGDLRVVHCNDPDCDPAVNGAESLTSPDTTGIVGLYTSLVLDAAGNPVISHYDLGNGDLRVVHCNDPDCDSAVNGAESLTSPDTTGTVGQYTSLALDAAGNPVISHHDAINGDLRVVHCNDPDCDPAVNGPESLTAPDTTGHVGLYTSLVLDAAGNPVISHYDASNGDLRVVHCNDPDCDPAVNGAESLTSPDTTGTVGLYTSLVLDAAGNRVVSYYDYTNGDLKVLRTGTVNTPPVASDDAYGVIGGATLTVLAPGVLGNDTDADNDALTAQLANPTTKGTLTLNPNGSFTYTPGENATGSDTFTYRAFDGLAASNVATVTITITAGCDGIRATRVGTPGNDTLTGTGGNDVIVALGGNDTIDTGSGNDRVCGGSGNDTIELGSGNDRGFGGTGSDNLRGGSGDDRLSGGDGNDTLDGGGDRDTLFGDAGIDRLFGGGDPDTLDGGHGSPDLCDGEGGSDTATAACEQRNSI